MSDPSSKQAANAMPSPPKVDAIHLGSPLPEEAQATCPLRAQSLGPFGLCKRWVARLLAILIAFPLILYLGFLLAMQFVDFNRYKPVIEDTFLQHTGYSLSIEGNLEVEVVPFSFAVKQVSIANPDGFDDKPLLQVKGGLFELSLWDLFIHRKVNILGLELDSPQLYLQRSASGHTNWQGLSRLLAGVPVRGGFYPVAYQTVRQDEAGPFVEDWHLNSLVVRNAEVVLTDLARHQGFQLKQGSLMAFDVVPEQPFKVIADGRFKAEQDPVTWVLSGNTKLQLNRQLTQLQALDWSGYLKMRLDSEFNVPEVRVELSGEEFTLDRSKAQFELQNAKLQSLQSELKLDVRGHYHQGQTTEMTGHLQATHFDLRKWFRHSGVALPKFVNQMVLTDMNAEFDWQKTPQASSIENLILSWDQSVLTGHIWQQESVGQAAQIRFDLALDQLNLDHYQAEAEQKKSPPVAKSHEQAKSEKTLNSTYLPLALPISLLRENQVAGQLKVGRLQAWEVAFEQVDLSLQAKEGRWAFAPLDAKLYQGQLQSKLILDVSGKTPAYDWRGKLNQVQLQPLLKEGWGYQDLAGQYDGQFELVTAGVNGYLLKQNLNGRFLAKIREGEYRGLDLNHLLTGQKSRSVMPIPFKSLLMDGQIRQGVYQVKRFDWQSDVLSVEGGGQVDLASAKLNAKLSARLLRPVKGLEAVTNTALPIVVKGELAKPKWSLDLKSWLQSDGLKALLSS